jgi:hypothetical protein
VSFGAVITVTVGTAGVLLVFIFLVAPAVMAVQVTDRLGRQLVFGWSLGVAATIVGLVVSYVADLSSGPVVIGAYAAALIVVSVVVYNLRAADRRGALRNTVTVGVVLLVSFSALLGVGARVGRRMEPEAQLSPRPADPPSVVGDSAAGPTEQAAEVLHAIEEDPVKGLGLAEGFLRENPPAFFAALVAAKLDSAAGVASGYDPALGADAPDNRRALRALRAALQRAARGGELSGPAEGAHDSSREK